MIHPSAHFSSSLLFGPAMTVMPSQLSQRPDAQSKALIAFISFPFVSVVLM